MVGNIGNHRLQSQGQTDNLVQGDRHKYLTTLKRDLWHLVKAEILGQMRSGGKVLSITTTQA